MPDPLFETFFDHTWPQWPPTERVPYISEKLDFWWSIPQKILRPNEVKKVSNGGSSINFHYSGTHWTLVFGRFVKTSGQAKSLLCINS